MAIMRRLESNSLDALIEEASKYPDWHVVGNVPMRSDGPPYVMVIRELLPEELATTETGDT